jgi:hypothetical protein
MWWIVLGDAGYKIVQCDIEPRSAVRGPFKCYTDAEDYRDYFERQEQKRETAAGYVVCLWGLFAIVILLHLLFS